MPTLLPSNSSDLSRGIPAYATGMDSIVLRRASILSSRAHDASEAGRVARRLPDNPKRSNADMCKPNESGRTASAFLSSESVSSFAKCPGSIVGNAAISLSSRHSVVNAGSDAREFQNSSRAVTTFPLSRSLVMPVSVASFGAGKVAMRLR